MRKQAIRVQRQWRTPNTRIRELNTRILREFKIRSLAALRAFTPIFLIGKRSRAKGFLQLRKRHAPDLAMRQVSSGTARRQNVKKRKSHTKSRNGCGPCKSRRAKVLTKPPFSPPISKLALLAGGRCPHVSIILHVSHFRKPRLNNIIIG